MSHDAFEVALLREDLAYHQARILLLVRPSLPPLDIKASSMA